MTNLDMMRADLQAWRRKVAKLTRNFNQTREEVGPDAPASRRLNNDLLAAKMTVERIEHDIEEYTGNIV